MSEDKREELINEILGDLTFVIKNSAHREELKQELGGEEEIRALEAFLQDRWYEEADFFDSVGDMY